MHDEPTHRPERGSPRAGWLWLLLTAIFALGPAPARAQPASPIEPEVLIVPVYAEIGTTTVALIRRAMSEARSLGVGWVLLEVDTPGGPITSMREVEATLAAIRESGVKTVAYVRDQALSAGGYLALACSETYMAPGATLGAITPVMAGPAGVQQIADDDARRKLLSAFRADVRSLIERRGLSGDALTLAEAMVDPRMRVFEITYEDESGADVVRVVSDDELTALESRGVKIRGQQQVGLKTPLTLTADEASRYNFSSGTFETLNDMLRDALGIDPDTAIRLDPSWSESAADWLESMKLIIFLFGFMLLMVEFKMPGFGVPGALGILLLSVGLFSSYLVGLAEWTEIILFFLGLILIGIEMFVMPGTIISGAVGFVCVVAALILSQQSFLIPTNATQTEILTDNLVSLLQLLILLVISTALVYKLLPRIPFVNRVLLAPPEDARTGDASAFAKAGAVARDALMGRVGAAITDLRPAGVLELDDGPVDVVTQGDFVERGTRVKVVEVSGNRVVVAPLDPESGAADIAWLVLLVVVGFALVIAEVFFVSFGILSIGAAVSLVSAVFLAFTEYGQFAGFVFLGVCAIGAPVCVLYALRVLPSTRFGKTLMLAGPEHEAVAKAAEEPGIAELRGKDGEAMSDLRPAGYAKIDGSRVDVVTRGEMITRGTRIQVVDVEGNRVVVAAHKESTNTV